MKREKLDFPLPVIVEGKYDKMKISEVANAFVITTEGFGIFNKKERLALIKRLSENGVVLLCDSDGAGGVIRRYIMSALPPEKIYNLYVPRVKGKERRKKHPSKEGVLGVEGTDGALLYEMLKNLSEKLKLDKKSSKKDFSPITKADFYALGLTGHHCSTECRNEVAKRLGLPDGMTAPALLGAVNILINRNELYNLCENINNTETISE